METRSQIEPQTVTKPIQLLAAWLVGLIVVNGSFLGASVSLGASTWQGGALVVAAIANVPIFLIALFVLQTRFRPELQEDSFYSEYLDKKTNRVISHDRVTVIESELASLRLAAERRIAQPAGPSEELIGRIYSIGLNDTLPDFAELFPVLKKRGVIISSFFGSDSKSSPPEKRVVSISNQVSFDSVVTVLKLAIDLKMDGYNYFSPFEDPSEEAIVFGSYGNASMVELTPELAKMLEEPIQPAELERYEGRHGKQIA